MTTEPDASRLSVDWAEAFVEQGLDLDELYTFVDGLYAEGTADAVFPQRSDVFRAFHLTPLKSVRAVILGQDPYPTEGHAHGLAFSYRGNRPFPSSLRGIFKNLANDPEIQLGKPINGDLTPWATNGVLLLNTALTFRTKDSGPSHMPEWQGFTDNVLKLVNGQPTRVAFLAWGVPAIAKVNAIGVADRHELIPTAHPAVWGKSKVRTFKDFYPFTEASNFLGSDPMDWRLPTATVDSQ